MFLTMVALLALAGFTCCQWGNRGGEKEIGRGEYAGIL